MKQLANGTHARIYTAFFEVYGEGLSEQKAEPTLLERAEAEAEAKIADAQHASTPNAPDRPNFSKTPTHIRLLIMNSRGQLLLNKHPMSKKYWFLEKPFPPHMSEPGKVVEHLCSLLDMKWDKSMLRHLGDNRAETRTVAIYVLNLPNNPTVKHEGFRWFTKEMLVNRNTRELHVERGGIGDKCQKFLFGAEKWNPGHNRWGAKPQHEANTSVIDMSMGKRPTPPSVAKDTSPPIALGAHKYAPNHRVHGTVRTGPNRTMVVELANARDKDESLTARLANPKGSRRFKPGDTVECRVIRAFATTKHGKRHSAFIAAVDVASIGDAEDAKDAVDNMGDQQLAGNGAVVDEEAQRRLEEVRVDIAAYWAGAQKYMSAVPAGSNLIATRGPKCEVSLDDRFSTLAHLDSLADVLCLGETVFDGVKDKLSDMGATFVAADHVKLRGIAGDGSTSLIGVVLNFPFRFNENMGMIRENFLVLRMHYSMILGAPFMTRYVQMQHWQEGWCTMWDTPKERRTSDAETYKVSYSTTQWDIKLGKNATCGVVRICASSVDNKGKRALSQGDASSSEEDNGPPSVDSVAASRRRNGKSPVPMPHEVKSEPCELPLHGVPPHEVKSEPCELPPGPSEVKSEPCELPPGPSNPGTMAVPPGPSNPGHMGTADNYASHVRAFYVELRKTIAKDIYHEKKGLLAARALTDAHNRRRGVAPIHYGHNLSFYVGQAQLWSQRHDVARMTSSEHGQSLFDASRSIEGSRHWMRENRSGDQTLYDMARESWKEACEDFDAAHGEFLIANRALTMSEHCMEAYNAHARVIRHEDTLAILQARMALLPSELPDTPPGLTSWMRESFDIYMARPPPRRQHGGMRSTRTPRGAPYYSTSRHD